MNTKKQLKAGKFSIILQIIIVLYIIVSVVYCAKIEYFAPGLHSPNTPLIAFILKWIYCIFLLIGINIKEDARKKWRVINFACIGITFIYFSLVIVFAFYPSIFILPIVEVIALIMLIYTNKDNYKIKYNIKLAILDYIIVLILPLIITGLCIYSIEYMLSVGYLYW